MLIRRVEDHEEFLAGDGSLLRELLHPGKTDLRIRYSLARAKVAAGETTKRHRLKTAEVYYILEGAGLMNIDKESSPVGPGSVIYIPPGAEQSIKNTGDSELAFLCIVDPAWRPEDETVLE